MFANGVSRDYSVNVNEKSVLNLKVLIIKILNFVLFLCHELSIYFISENLNYFRITEQFLKG